MSLFITADKIPLAKDERPISSLNGFMFASQAWHCRHDDLWPPKAGERDVDPSWRAAIDLYLANFCRPVKSIANEVHCVACNELLTRPQMIKVAHVLYDPASGEGRCPSCAYPLKTKHDIYLPAPREKTLLVKLPFFPLCYHPVATEMGQPN